MTPPEFLSRLDSVRRSGAGWTARCPAHADKNPSLSISEKNGKILLKCFAGCSTESVLVALGVEAKELFTAGPMPKKKSQIVATYDYTDERGTLLYQNVRYEPKDFRLRRPDGKDGWNWSVAASLRTIYNLPAVLAAKDILITEGEKDADTGNALRFTCTTSGSAGSWKDEFSERLRGKRVTIIADADEPGRKHARQVAASLYGKVESLMVLELPGEKDLSQWHARGGTRDALLELMSSGTQWKPPSVDGDAVLTKVLAFIRRFVSLSESQARVVSLWIAHTYTFQAVDATPYLAITSAEKQCGKSRLLEVLQVLVVNPWMTGRVTAAILIRKVDAEQPTLLLDESDAAFAGEKEYAETLRGILNSGHRSSGKASCCIKGADISYKDFRTFCPKAIAGIGNLPDTVADRSVPIRLKRAAPGEVVERFRLRDVQAEATALRNEIEAWCLMIAESLTEARPELPDALTDRQQDGAEPLLAIADAAGGAWPKWARAALVELCSEAQRSDDSIGKQLLADICQIFKSKGLDRLSSADLAAALADIETSPWCEWSHGKPLTPGKLARLLKPFEVSPEGIRVGDKTPRGYLVGQFQDAFRRYLRAQCSSALSSPTPKSAQRRNKPILVRVSAILQSATPKSMLRSRNATNPIKTRSVAMLHFQARICSLLRARMRCAYESSG